MTLTIAWQAIVSVVRKWQNNIQVADVSNSSLSFGCNGKPPHRPANGEEAWELAGNHLVELDSQITFRQIIHFSIESLIPITFYYVYPLQNLVYNEHRKSSQAVLQIRLLGGRTLLKEVQAEYQWAWKNVSPPPPLHNEQICFAWLPIFCMLYLLYISCFR